MTRHLWIAGFHLCLALVGLLSLLPRPASSQEKSDSSSSDERDRLKLAAEHVRELLVRRAEGDKEDIELIGRPLLSYGDPARSNENGTLWAWGTSGRPVVFLEMYQGTGTGARWVHAVTLTSSQRVVMKATSTANWQPEKTQIEPAPIPGASQPDEKELGRLRQIKDLSRRFTAHEFWNPDNSRFELRLLVQPVHRYKDPSAGIQDGAAFVLAHGTNPELILLVEALGKSVRESRWHYSLARLGSAELHVEIDGTGVWKQGRTPGVVGVSSDPYWLFFSPVVINE